MATTSSGGGVIDTVRHQLAAGYSSDEIVDGLIAGGLSRPSAERFVQRAGGQVTSSLAATPPPMPTAVPPPVPGFATTAFVASPPPIPVVTAYAPPVDAAYASPAAVYPPVDVPPPVPSWAPPPVPDAYASSPVPQTPFAPPTYAQQPGPYPAYAGAAAASSSPKGSVNGLKLAGGAALFVVGMALLALSLSASGRVRLKVPLALVFGGGATLVQAIRER